MKKKAIESIKVQSASSSLLAHSSGSRFNNYFEYYYYSGNTWFLKVDSSGKTAIENTKNGKNILGFRDSVNSLRSAEIKWLDFAGASATSWVVAIITAPTGFGLAVGTLTAVGLAFLANSYAEDMKAYADDCRFYFLRVLSGWIEDGKYTWYYYDIYGNKTIGWKNIMSKWYYFNSSGVMQFGWLLDGGKWYYLDYLTGAMKTGWLLDGGNWYYLNSPSGNMSNSGWQLIGGKYYYFYSNGVMAVNTTIGGYRVGSDGAWIP
ncbi:hypothetical protein FAY30_26625 (plasmid) [Bacillus sp. S3]|uniref:geobacillin-26 family protein n=1 Tax=Bacillus sp. S3 TaxID=486398 RepID=UPI00118D5895|nr:geobacillin-26 family protein [Bacillus sp. S3]QCJ45516.1 hypothetical protein FAY30_26625 [Bacillus sp. S3]